MKSFCHQADPANEQRTEPNQKVERVSVLKMMLKLRLKQGLPAGLGSYISQVELGFLLLKTERPTFLIKVGGNNPNVH